MIFRWQYYGWTALAAAFLAALAAYLFFMFVLGGDEPANPAHAGLRPDPQSPDFVWNRGTLYRFSLDTNRSEVTVRLPRRAPGTASGDTAFLVFAPPGDPEPPSCPAVFDFPDDASRSYRSHETVALIACALSDPPDDDPPATSPTPTPTLSDDTAARVAVIELRSARKPAILLRRYALSVAADLDEDAPFPTPVDLSLPAATLVPEFPFASLPARVWTRRTGEGNQLQWSRAERATGYQVQRRHCPGGNCDAALWTDLVTVTVSGNPLERMLDGSALARSQPANHFAYRLRTLRERHASAWGPPALTPLDVSVLAHSTVATLSWNLPDLPEGTDAVILRRHSGRDFRAATTLRWEELQTATTWTESGGGVRDAATGRYLVQDLCYRLQLVTNVDHAGRRSSGTGLAWPQGSVGSNCVPETHDLALVVACDGQGLRIAWDSPPPALGGDAFRSYEIDYEVNRAANVPEAARGNPADAGELLLSPHRYTVLDPSTGNLVVPLLPDRLAEVNEVGGYRADVRVTAHYGNGRSLPPRQRWCLSAYSTWTPTPTNTWTPIPTHTHEPTHTHAPGWEHYHDQFPPPTSTPVPTHTHAPTHTHEPHPTAPPTHTPMPDEPTATPTQTPTATTALTTPDFVVENLRIVTCTALTGSDDGIQVELEWSAAPDTHQGQALQFYRITQVANNVPTTIDVVPNSWNGSIMDVDTVRYSVQASYGSGSIGSILTHHSEQAICTTLAPMAVENVHLDSCSYNGMTDSVLVEVDWDPSPDITSAGLFVKYEIRVSHGGGSTTLQTTDSMTSFHLALNGATVTAVNAYVVAQYRDGDTVTNTPPSPSVSCLPAAPAQPQNLNAHEISGDRVLLNWDADTASTITAYSIQRRVLNSGDDYQTLTDSAPSTSTVYTDGTAPVGFVYEYRVIANNSHGSSVPSQPATVSLLGAATATPTRTPTPTPTVTQTPTVTPTPLPMAVPPQNLTLLACELLEGDKLRIAVSWDAVDQNTNLGLLTEYRLFTAHISYTAAATLPAETTSHTYTFDLLGHSSSEVKITVRAVYQNTHTGTASNTEPSNEVICDPPPATMTPTPTSAPTATPTETPRPSATATPTVTPSPTRPF